MNYKQIIIIILLIIIIIFIYKKKVNQEENFTLNEVLQNMASIYEESDETLRFRNLKAFGDTALKRVIINSTFLTKDGLTNSGGSIINTGSGGIINNGGNIINRGKLNTGETTITGKLNVEGDISGNLVSLRGMIVMWSGSIGNIPDGWKLCDGQTHNNIKTPDLRSRFIVGAATQGAVVNTGLTVKAVNDISGVETVTLTEAQLTAHRHFGFNNSPIAGVTSTTTWGTVENINYTNASSGNALNSTNTPISGILNSTNSANYLMVGRGDIDANSGRTSATGSNEPHNNMPPYYALAYIMKI